MRFTCYKSAGGHRTDPPGQIVVMWCLSAAQTVALSHSFDTLR
jgi:hypothetical protein